MHLFVVYDLFYCANGLYFFLLPKECRHMDENNNNQSHVNLTFNNSFLANEEHQANPSFMEMQAIKTQRTFQISDILKVVFLVLEIYLNYLYWRQNDYAATIPLHYLLLQVYLVVGYAQVLTVFFVLGLTLVSLRVSIKLSILLSSAQRFSQTKSFCDKINIKQFSYCEI